MSILTIKPQKHFLSSRIQRSLNIYIALLKGKRHGNLDACQKEQIKGTFNRKKKRRNEEEKKLAQLSLFNYAPGFIEMNEL